MRVFVKVQKLTIVDRVEDSIREDIAILKSSQLINKSTQIIGLKYDIHTGLLSQVSENASEL
jgi:carbonic anhydrase